MTVRCISNAASALPKELIRPDLGLQHDRQFPLVVGKDYVVYAMTVFLGHLWYYICDQTYTHYPVWNPAPLFEVANNRVSIHWRLGFHRGSSAGEVIPIIAFAEWVEDPLFYDRLTDGQEHAVATFARYKRLLDAEDGVIEGLGQYHSEVSADLNSTRQPMHRTCQ